MTASAITNPEWRLAPGHTHPTLSEHPLDDRPWIPYHRKLGLNNIGSHRPKLKLADYYDSALAAPPSAVARPHPSFNWGMLANDSLGDCVCAMILHSIEDFHLEGNTPPPGFTDADAILLYEKIGGFNPNDPQNTDNGCDEATAMSEWESGLPKTSDGKVHQITATVAVDPQNLTECRLAIYEFVALQIGIALPLTAQGQTEWTVVGDPNNDPNSAPGSWGGHGIPFREYDPDTFKCVTWGAELLLTVPFHTYYTGECHVVVTQEMLDAKGDSPTGVQWSQLASDINALTGSKVEKAAPKRPRSRGKAADEGGDNDSPDGDDSGKGKEE